MLITQEAIVRQAREWIGTPFHHQARVKGKGCDCLGLVVGVARDLALMDQTGKPLIAYDETNYSHQPDSVFLIQKLQSVLQEVPKDQLQSGDIGLFSIDGNPQHIAIFCDYDGITGMIHSYAPARKVIEHRFNKEWQSKLVGVFRWLP